VVEIKENSCFETELLIQNLKFPNKVIYGFEIGETVMLFHSCAIADGEECSQSSQRAAICGI